MRRVGGCIFALSVRLFAWAKDNEISGKPLERVSAFTRKRRDIVGSEQLSTLVLRPHRTSRSCAVAL